VDASDAQKEFLDQVERDLQAATAAARSFRRQYRNLAIGGAISAGLAAALTGTVAAGGPDLADAMGGWRLVCALAALFAATAAILAGIQERLRTPEHVAGADACMSQLNALRFALRTGSSDLEAHREEYREILRQYSRYLAGT
jgi:MFS family permease